MDGVNWRGALVAMLVWGGLAWGQSSPAPSTVLVENGSVVTLQELGKPPQRCRVLASWKEPRGMAVFEVQCIGTGERMTIAESEPIRVRDGSSPGQSIQSMTSRIYHWMHDTPPAGAPTPPADALVKSDRLACSPCTDCPPRSFLSFPTMSRWLKSGKKDTCPTETCDACTSCTPCEKVVVSPAPVKNQKAPASLAQASHKDDGADKVQKASMTVTKVSPEKSETESKKPVVTSETTPARPSDWRESWGKESDNKMSAPPSTDLPRADRSRPDPLEDPVTYGRKPKDEKSIDPNDVAAIMANDAKKRAETSAAKSGAKLSGDGKSATEDSEKRKDKKPTEVVAPKPAPDASRSQQPKTDKGPVGALMRFFGKGEENTPEVVTVVEKGRQQPLASGAQSVFAAGDNAPGQMYYVPVPIMTTPPMRARPPVMAQARPMPMPPPPPPPEPGEVENAFTSAPPEAPPPPPPPPADSFNAFGSAPTSPAPAPTPNALNPASPNAMNPAVAMNTSAGFPRVRPGMSPQQYPAPVGHAVVPTDYSRPGQQVAYSSAPMPAQSPTQYAMAPAGMNAPRAYGMDRQAYSQAYQPAPMPDNELQEMLKMLHGGLQPSMREWAAENMTRFDGRTNPVVVGALLQRARVDPVPAVRAACIRSLDRMRMNTPSVVSVLEEMKADTDPTVRQQVTETLMHFGAGGSASAKR